MISIIRRLQFLWSGYLFIVVLVSMIIEPSSGDGWYLFFCFIYLCASFFVLFFGSRLPWLITILVPFYIFLRFGLSMLYEISTGGYGHFRFDGSPLTILLMHFIFILIVLPSMVLSILYLINIKNIWQIFKSGERFSFIDKIKDFVLYLYNK